MVIFGSLIFPNCVCGIYTVEQFGKDEFIDLPDEMKYDSHNRLTEYIVTDDRKVRLHYDPVGRVFRKEIYGWVSEDWNLTKAIHYYYKGSSLVQEYEVTVESETTAVADIEWDYLRGVGGRVIRKRETDGATVTDTLHVNSPIGTTMNVLFPDVDTPPLKEGGYKTTADGEPFWVSGFEPQEENHIQYHGGFLEDKEFHTSEAGVERGYFYRMGVRHYSPMLGRFLQKDPMTLSRQPSKRTPLAVNPYSYALNRPLQLRDITGYQPCPGCIDNVGGAIGNIMDMPLNLDQPNDSGGGGNGGDVSDEDDGSVCTRWMPRSCLVEGENPDLCVEWCCEYDDSPPDWNDCCNGERVDLMPCHYTDEGDCECGCCGPAGGGDRYAPGGADCFGYG